jgi:MoaA/NifB/PqqE/SkfB family radical SAM enzyme
MDKNRSRPIYKELKSPVTAQMALTYGCNNLCRYCYNSTRGLENQNKGTNSNKNFSNTPKLIVIILK